LGHRIGHGSPCWFEALEPLATTRTRKSRFVGVEYLAVLRSFQGLRIELRAAHVVSRARGARDVRALLDALDAFARVGVRPGIVNATGRRRAPPRARRAKAVAAGEAFVAQIGDEIVGLVLDLIGFTDAKKCISEGDVGACISTALNAVPWGKMFKAAKVAIKAIGVGKRLVEGYSKLKAASKALADIPRWNPKVVPDSAAIKQANTAAEQAKDAANQTRTVASRTSQEVDDAKRANDQARKAAENKKSDTCNSFVPGTGVVMADGSVKAIDDVAVGDTVVAVAADGSRTYRQVVATITGHGAKDLVGLTLVGSGGGGPPAGESITATDGHLFLTADGQWVPAKDLQVGDQLVDPDGTPVAIGAVEHDTVVATVHNLTVDTDHTYTVVTTAGTDAVTHNADLRNAMGCPAGRGGGSARADGDVSGASSAAQGAKLAEHLRQAAKYGKAGHRELENGRIRYYGDLSLARTPGEMVGRRLVREWDPSSGATRMWHETLDGTGTIRIVRPVTPGPKTHYMFDANGGYAGSW